ncbi:hypothetical protein GCM10007036_24670 [Alsobacter metallidurans]|uniref:Uncharacterized protein n=1 Tax=Alsobacter metallidurans TaxID=340221 RepID=A0A917MJZ8_9HYPH|nr:hypothetical protein GCM10007036_24670 [Alsobacter metallidurans]
MAAPPTMTVRAIAAPATVRHSAEVAAKRIVLNLRMAFVSLRPLVGACGSYGASIGEVSAPADHGRAI